MFEIQIINDTYNDRQLVSGRDLHNFLEVDSNYTTWFKRMMDYGFSENIDFIPFLEESTGGRPSQDHQLTIDMAKEISMLQRSEKGKQARKYFIEVEKAWNSPDMVIKRALELANEKIKQLGSQVEKMAPKALFADAVATSKTSILVGDLAKILKQNGKEIGANRLFEWLRNNGYLIKRKGSDFNMPTQLSMEMKLFEIKETTINCPDGHIKISRTPKVTGKGQQYFINKFLGGK